jgi:hypothetical protein
MADIDENGYGFRKNPYSGDAEAVYSRAHHSKSGWNN